MPALEELALGWYDFRSLVGLQPSPLLAATSLRRLRGLPAAVAAACATLALPGALALLVPAGWFSRRRNWIVAGCRLASMMLLERAVPPTAPAGPEWPGGLKLLVLTRTLSLNMFAWANRLPLRWLVWVQLAGALQAARICVLYLCPSPALSGQAAEAPLRRMASAAGALRVLLPTPGMLTADAPICAGQCLCQRVSLWLLACFGWALPVMAQLLSQTAARQAFVRRHRRCACCPRCDQCIQLLSPDLATLEVSAAVLFVGFAAAAWQAVVAWSEWAAAAAA
ncbi:vacuolar ATPase assembly integral membrane VMA21 isoform X1 [Chlorella sorokiniana]|uniref:Vacuolar ATPase assembly integral membrane VMA21 isoform X1 n=1 Tax=Chlorella sorokiniana TaxID=3076 RepID=A0A2P6U279_CHLSO|nr:vacuolar ATPase assembly integral membrane VMA21 isoform X1 [Chlorella sorokiniana]|eukprot:PRW60409.1 vacuolar ATPase assembly integral membrane VMA21 isoform X1 [Chlorella sorokiniana]